MLVVGIGVGVGADLDKRVFRVWWGFNDLFKFFLFFLFFFFGEEMKRKKLGLWRILFFFPFFLVVVDFSPS